METTRGLPRWGNVSIVSKSIEARGRSEAYIGLGFRV